METIKKTLFEETKYISETYYAETDHELRNELVLEFQILYDVIRKAGIEQEYLEWRANNNEDNNN